MNLGTLNYDDQRKSLSEVPRLTPSTTDIGIRVCQTYRNRNNVKYIWLPPTTTLRKLKERICRELSLSLSSADVTLTIYIEDQAMWTLLDDTNIHSTISDANISRYSTINVEKREEANSDQSHSSTIRSSSLTLRLCRRPMDKSDPIYLDTYSTITLGQLKDEARKKVKTKKTNQLYLWTRDNWTLFEATLDDCTLADLSFKSNSFVSFEAEDDPIPGICGLTNLGNTCFINSALQCLSHVPQFTRTVLSFGNEMNAPIIGAYAALMKAMWSGHHLVTTPSSLLLNVREDLAQFPRYKQHDAQEFMNCFLHLIHQELTSEETVVTNLFYGRIRSRVRCLGGCGSMEVNEESISFLPLPIEDDSDQYKIRYLSMDGELQLVSIRSRSRTVGELVESFIERCKPELSPRRILVVRLIDNKIRETYQSNILLNETIKQWLTFIELPQKTVEQKFVELRFLHRETQASFQPPIFLVRPIYDCRYADLSEQIKQVQKHLCSASGAPFEAADHVFWTNTYRQRFSFNSGFPSDDMLLFMHHIAIEMDSSWVEQYQRRHQCASPTNNSSLASLLTDFFREEPLDGDYYCSNCLTLTKAKQKADLTFPLPRVLVIQLKRFTFETHSDRKIDAFIHFPLEGLDLSNYIADNSGQTTNPSAVYDLVAVSNHTGTLLCGHYTTYAKNDRNQKWYSFNDETTREIADEKDIVTRNAYILVYVRRLPSHT